MRRGVYYIAGGKSIKVNYQEINSLISKFRRSYSDESDLMKREEKNKKYGMFPFCDHKSEGFKNTVGD